MNWPRLVELALTLLCFAVPSAQAQSARVPGADTYGLARDAYLFAYPIVSMDMTMRQATNVPDANTILFRAPVNQFAHARAYPNADQKDVVRPNFDTLYSLAWIDVSREPIVLSVPDTNGRYYLLQMLDMWTDVFSVVGSRTTGTRAGYYALVAPDWRGTLPQGVEKVVAPTPTFWIVGRTQTNGPADYANVHNVQGGYRLAPLGQWGKDYTPAQNFAIDAAIDGKTPPAVQVNRLNGIAMLSRLSVLMSKYPPHVNDNPILFRLRALGLEPGKAFDPSSLSPQIIATINTAARDAQDDMQPGLRSIGRVVNGWNVLTENVGTYGTSYRQRALIAYGGLGANLPEDAIYPTAFIDADGKPLSSANKYVLRFSKGRLPPVDAFWSITMYDQDGFQVANPSNRYAIGDRDKLTFNADGSLDIYIQAETPGKDKESNWLPAPKNAAFQPTMRIYSPRREVADGTWSPPGIRRVDSDALDSRGTSSPMPAQTLPIPLPRAN